MRILAILSIWRGTISNREAAEGKRFAYIRKADSDSLPTFFQVGRQITWRMKEQERPPRMPGPQKSQ